MSQSFLKRTDNGPHSALAGLGVLRSEIPADPLDLLRRIVKWRDEVHAGRVVRGAELESLIEEARGLLGNLGAARGRKPLKEEQIIDATEHISMDAPGCFIRIARAIEAAHGIGVPAKEPASS